MLAGDIILDLTNNINGPVQVGLNIEARWSQGFTGMKSLTNIVDTMSLVGLALFQKITSKHRRRGVEWSEGLRPNYG